MEATREAKVDWATCAVASHILACIHIATPGFPVELVLKDLNLEERRTAE